MTSSLGYMELCRLCLVKDKVTVPIFGDTNDVRQIFLKITACLPVKVSRDDNLPKKICDTCLYKIDLLYQFWNTTINAEKQLIQWLNEIGVDAKNVDASLQMLPQSHAHPHAMQEEIMLKEERIESETKDGATGFSNMYTEYPYQNPENNFDTPPVVEETTTAKRKTRGRPAGKKKAKIVIPESEDEDSIGSDRLGNDDTNDSDSDGGKIAKQEADSDEDYVDNPESLEPTTFVDVPSAADAEQPGPSGLSKPATITAGTSDQGTLKAKRPAPHARIQVIELQDGTKRKYICEICSRQFGDRRQFTIHNRSHSERVYPCSKCSKKFRFPSQLKTHEIRHQAAEELKCDECNKRFANTDTLILHRRRHLKDYSYHCDECNKGFYNNSAYKTHCEMEHLGVTFTCAECHKVFKCSYNYNEHVKQHDPNYVRREYQCDKCEKVYQVANSLRKHIQTVHEKTMKHLYICDICGKSVASQINLNNHRRIHTGERPYICQSCGKNFKSSEGLMKHERTHTKVKPYPCNVCDRQFSQRSSLVVHSRYHTGERPYTCIVCDKKFVTLTLMKYHRKTHGITVEKSS